MQKIVFSETALNEYKYWKDTNNSKILSKIKKLIKDIEGHPFMGIGKPEPLSGNYSGYWSRRINREHRLVYKISKDTITILQCRFHYE